MINFRDSYFFLNLSYQLFEVITEDPSSSEVNSMFSEYLIGKILSVIRDWDWLYTCLCTKILLHVDLHEIFLVKGSRNILMNSFYPDSHRGKKIIKCGFFFFFLNSSYIKIVLYCICNVSCYTLLKTIWHLIRNLGPWRFCTNSACTFPSFNIHFPKCLWFMV